MLSAEEGSGVLVIIGVLQYILFDVCFYIYWILEYD